MNKVDIIILSNTADRYFHNLLSITVNSIKKQTEVDSNIILVETNKEYKTKEQYNLPIDILIVPDEPFHFNKFLNHGLKYSTADYIVFSNNDVEYFPNSLAEMVKALQTFDSVSPHGIGYSCHHFNGIDIVEHCQINRSFLGYCYAFTRKTMNECFDGKFDERFAFYRQDDDVVHTLLKNKFRHASVGPAKVQHLNLHGNHGRGTNSHKLFGDKETIDFYTEGDEQRKIFYDKWRNGVA